MEQKYSVQVLDMDLNPLKEAWHLANSLLDTRKNMINTTNVLDYIQIIYNNMMASLEKSRFRLALSD